MCMTFGYNPQIIFCHFFHSLNLVIFSLYQSLYLRLDSKLGRVVPNAFGAVKPETKKG